LGVHRQPAARPLPARRHSGGGARRRERAGHRQGDAARLRLSDGPAHPARFRGARHDLQDRRDHVHRVSRAALRAAAAAEAHGAGRHERPQDGQGLLRLRGRPSEGRRPGPLTRPPSPPPSLDQRTRMFGYDWPRFHAAVNDLPAALLFVTVLFEIGGWLTKRASLKAAALWTLWAGVVGGWVAVLAGLKAEDVIEHGEAIHELMEQHERQALITMGIFTVVLVWKLYRRFQLAPIEDLVLRGLSVLGFVGLLYTATIGGKLAFEH